MAWVHVSYDSEGKATRKVIGDVTNRSGRTILLPRFIFKADGSMTRDMVPWLPGQEQPEIVVNEEDIDI